MEVLKKSRKGALLLLACTVAIVFAITALSVSGTRAYADNSEYIGGASSSETIVFSDVTVREEGLSYSDATKGVTISVKVPSTAYDISIAYEVEFSESVWPIGGAPTDDNLPASYVRISGDNAVAEHEVYGKLVTGWTAVRNAASGYQTADITVNINGTLYVKYTTMLEGEDGQYHATDILGQTDVTVVDVLAPARKSVTQNRIPDNGSYRNEFKVVFYDLGQTGAIPSARSGLMSAEIFYSAAELTSLTQEQLSELKSLASWSQKSYSSPVVNEVTLDFTVSDDGSGDGYYYYFLRDRAGNYAIYDFFGRKYVSNDDARYIVTTTANGETTRLNVASNMYNFSRTIEENKSKVSSTLYDTVSYAYSELVWAFNKQYDGYTDDERIAEVSKLYWGFVRGTYQKFLDAVNGAEYKFEVSNSDLLFGTLRLMNFDGSVPSAVGGQVVKAEVNVARYDFNEVADEILELADMGSKGKVYKLAYKLTVDGSSAFVPSEAIMFELGGEPGTFIDTSEFAIVIKAGNEYKVKEHNKGSVWFTFSTEYNTADIYIVVPESSLPATLKNGSDGLSAGAIAGICIGAVALACGIGVGVYFILKKKGIVGAQKTVSDKANDTSAEDAQVAQVKKPKNKSKKRKKNG